MKPEIYLEDVEDQIERLLTNMDRNRDADTFGCLARPFWHDKVTDFPSAHQQIGVMPLTLAYTQDWKGNPYYQSKEIKELIDAGLEFWASIQKKNGSFDEHYPNEHSLGAVAWTLWAVTESYLMLEDPPSIEQNIRKAVDFIRRNDEPGDIANHQAVTASALVNSHRILGEGLEEAEERIDLLEDMQDENGWFQEYRGADLGYQSTTITHIARVWQYDRNLVPETMIREALDFFTDFLDRENYYAGIIGSRNTDHLHTTGFEIFAEEFADAEKLANAARHNMEEGRLLQPYRMDDKHFSRQLAEYMDSYRRGEKLDSGYPEVREAEYGCISVHIRDEDLIFVNESKGGVYRRFRKGELVDEDSGISVEKDGEFYTSNWPASTDEVSKEGDSISIRGRMREVPRNTMPGTLFLASRVFNYTFGRFPSLSLKAKNFLISWLIGSDGEGPEFRRKIDLQDGLDVQDSFEGSGVEGKIRSNFVPSSEFFSKRSLNKDED